VNGCSPLFRPPSPRFKDPSTPLDPSYRYKWVVILSDSNACALETKAVEAIKGGYSGVIIYSDKPRMRISTVELMGLPLGVTLVGRDYARYLKNEVVFPNK
jgi:hypothetical protein